MAVSYELTPANVAEVGLTGELLARSGLLLGGEGPVRRLFGNLAYLSETLEEALAETGILLW